ncbi:ABC transporter substrate-binding protein [Steroidobacter denitrificans]|uniref:ABC transporter substrate-binding protein n=1 Tax=Steroidobacter denitrificans TaxID=465721 RepID=A0A127FC63_STEDE|nr:ABC transporter substrate-binding protein [Steroidobacter denitrificans]AMN47986.1 ABC transporter substrate-binding protein [Steroidobacter denitrificans]
MRRRDFLQALALASWSAAIASPTAARTARAAGTGIAAAFGEIPPSQRVARIFAAGAPAGILVNALAPEKLLGWPLQLGKEARSWLAPAARDRPFLGRLGGRGSTVSVETLLQLKPDLILDVGSTDATHVSAMRRLAEQTGLPCLLIQGRLAEHPVQLREVGQLLGVAARGERLAAWADDTLVRAARVRAALTPNERPRVYFGRGADGLETGLAGSINMEVIDAAAGINVAAAAGRGGLARVSLEQILAWNPDVIITHDRNFVRRALRDPLWRALEAVRAGRVYCAPSTPFGWLDLPPGINRLIGVCWLLARLHAGRSFAPTLEDVRTDTDEFYRLFYGTDLATSAFDRLLEGDA